MNRHLVVGVAHELPAQALGLLGDTRIVLAGARIDGEGWPDSEPLVELEKAPGTDPHAVFVPAPVRHVRKQRRAGRRGQDLTRHRSEEHTSELQSPDHLVCRLLLEKKKKTTHNSKRT